MHHLLIIINSLIVLFIAVFHFSIYSSLFCIPFIFRFTTISSIIFHYVLGLPRLAYLWCQGSVIALPELNEFSGFLRCLLVSHNLKIIVFFFQYYGFPRLYRRFAEFNRRVTSNRQTIRRRQDAMKFVFRIPNKIAAFFRYCMSCCNNSELRTFPPNSFFISCSVLGLCPLLVDFSN